MKTSLQDVANVVTKRFVLPETTLFVTLCTFDMLYTLYCVRAGLAREANPILRDCLAQSNMTFVLIKGASFLIPITLLELIRRSNPKFVAAALRVGFIGYLTVYLAGSIALLGSSL